MKFLALLLCFSFLLPTISVRAEEKAVVGVSTVYEERRGVNVDIGIYIHSKEKLAGGSLDLVYDKDLLTVSKAVVGDQMTSYLSSTNDDQPGKVSFVWADESGEALEGTLLTVSVRLSKASETIPLKLENVQLFSEGLSLVPVDLLDGSIKPFKGDKQKHPSKVKGDKQWTIRLNNEFRTATLNKHTVRMKDSRGYEVDIIIKKRDNKSFTVQPKSTLSRGNYTLEITEQLRSIKGNKLKTAIQREFTVE
ncbi:Ig-like domain-containing protein [Bacillus sp. FJAT-42315]|uniref:Ig-like domain-containing protein n=1 Tax=Bacillus sp. FJAT-42315 TaxID=2014077 RepID=UPI0012FF1310|nr:Ig-like domain-containing protein [Bacillus sp. FJAT-42315]